MEQKQSWIAICSVRYCVTFAIGWIVVAAVCPPFLLLPAFFLMVGGGVLLLVTAVFEGAFGAVMPAPLASRED
ncbi:hypothetical protein ACFYNY_18280 [Streptomyces sp. NPDC006530]|uniref:hypothetical protein n=1 Tax=Streptomyces sp. NPDC006530 TaxID=3364750 RepID=UPI00369808F9